MTAILTGRGRQRQFDAPPPPQSLTDGAIFYPGFFSPLRYRHRFPAKPQNRVAAPVVVLFPHVRPPAVFRAVPCAIVNSVKRHPVGPIAHVCKEVFKHQPSLTDGNSPAPVVLEIPMARAETSFLHRAPRQVSWRLGARHCLPVPRCARAILAMAGLHVSGSDVGNNALPNFITKRAPEVSIHVSVSGARVLKKRQRAEFRAGLQKFVSRHSSHGLIISIMGGKGNCYGQRENALASLQAAYIRAGGLVA